MYTEWFWIEWDAGNNSFCYDPNKENKIYVPSLIQWKLDDLAIGENTVFQEMDKNNEIQSFKGLKNHVQIGNTYIFDNHNHALYYRYKELKEGNISKWATLIHIDQHTDMNQIKSAIDTNRENDLDYIAEFTNYECNVGNFIKPAIDSGLVGKVEQVTTEYKLLNLPAIDDNNLIVDIDIDFWDPKMGIEKRGETIAVVNGLISKAKVVTIATSPYFIDQEMAIGLVRELLK